MKKMNEVCDECYECEYFKHDYWNCQGDSEPCIEFIERITNGCT